MILNTSLTQPRVYQFPVITAVKNALEIRDEVLFVMATGLGKSIVSALVVQEWLENGWRGLFLCHENYILEQVEQDYRKVLGNDLDYKKFYGDESEKHWDADKADMLFASFQSLNSSHDKWYQAFEPNHFDFMIVDESHHGHARTFKEIIDYFECKKIGMTAIPDRMDLKDIREIFGKEVYTITLEEGIANGWLCNVEYHILSDGIDNRKLKKICKEVFEKGKRVSIKQINETIFIHNRDKEEQRIIDEYTHIKEHTHRKKTLLFCERTTHADNIISHFENADVMHSKKSKTHNRKVFEDFCNDQLQYVASVNKFNEGKHVPGVEGIVFLRATDSLTIWFQQLGRALAKTGEKTKVIILDFVANIERLIMVRDMMLRVKKIQDEVNKEKGIKLELDTHQFNVSGEGFDFIFSDEMVDIIKVVDALRAGYYSTCREASLAARALGPKTGGEYAAVYKKDLRLPSDPRTIYEDFPGWGIFLGIYDVDLPLLLQDKEKVLHMVKDALIKNGITDYWKLRYEHKTKLKKMEFGVLGKMYRVYFLVFGSRIRSLDNFVLDDFAKYLNWYPTDEEKTLKYREELLKEKIVDYSTLMNFPAHKLQKTTFGIFGKGKNFIKVILNDVHDVSPSVYGDLAKALGWGLSEEEKREEYKRQFILNGITDRASLLKYTSADLKKVSFGNFGKGVKFFSHILSDAELHFSRKKIGMVADYLGWTEDKDPVQEVIHYKEVLAKHGIVDYVTFLNFGPRKFLGEKLETFGSGYKLLLKILEVESIKPRWKFNLDLVAKKLDWELTEEDKRSVVLKEFAKYEITDYWTLREYGSIRFKSTTFGPLGKGYKLFLFVFGKTTNRIVMETLDEIAQYLGWFPSEGNKISKYKEKLYEHKLYTRKDLKQIHIAEFRNSDFGLFGKGEAFISEVLGKIKTKVSLKSLSALAEKLGLPDV